MATRTVLVSGPESARIAAATALHHARQGSDTLLLAADDPHRAVDELLGVRLGPEPVELEAHLAAARIDEQAAFRAALDGCRDRIAPALDLIGAEPLDPEELTPLPGTRALALLRALPRAKAEVLVVAAPPPAELIATLALPAQLERYLARLLPEQRQAARALRPLLAGLAGVPMPTDKLFEARAAASAALAEAAAAITAPGTTVRLVLDAARPAPGCWPGSGPGSPCTACRWTRWSRTARCPPPRPIRRIPGWLRSPSASRSNSPGSLSSWAMSRC
ncbi:ArsA-related P-loop ATPase [Streptomyces sp. TLI_171]|uniref:ArsA-related P-loop ATPase n=1 Tax=Streptomyces sp. TLI_171 TaxID=1938859 RepID=UPI0026CC4847|nr:ArsA-related P-loop ATPase [Streptomyces sp. TLI_171]